MVRVVSCMIGYACGCFLTADVVCRLVAGKSAFEVGVGNPGMANVGHELGVRWAAIVLVGDIGKTLAAWLCARALFPEVAGAAGIWAGLGATLGHNYPIWHRFRGGKGVTTTCSAIVLTQPALGFTSLIIGLATVVLAGYLCLGALAISVSWLVFMLLFGGVDARLAAVVFMVCMLAAHGGAAVGICTGETPRAGISEAFWRRIHSGRS